MEQTELLIKSTIDGTLQPSLYYKSHSKEKRPLLVGLHSWSHNRFNQINNMLPYAEKYDFNLLLPDFRGDNLATNPNCTYACASKYAIGDIKNAIDYVIENENADAENVFLLGFSGGGHMTLMMCGNYPEYFKAACAYVPITDLKKWADANEYYRTHVLACCSNSENEMLKRSPIYYADTIAKANLKICHGKFDPVVPVSQSLELYDYIMKNHKESRVFLEIFDGGHEVDMQMAMYWIISQYKGLNNTQVTG